MSTIAIRYNHFGWKNPMILKTALYDFRSTDKYCIMPERPGVTLE